MSKSHPQLYEQLGVILPQMQRFWYDTSMLEEPVILDVVRQSLGVDRLVFGSDLPRGPLSEAVDFVTSTDRLSEPEKAQRLDVAGAQARAPADRDTAISAAGNGPTR